MIGGAIGAKPELYDPIAGTWTSTSAEGCPWSGTVTLLSDGKLLVVAGDCAELYDPIAGTWSLTGAEACTSRSSEWTPPRSAALLSDGRSCSPATVPSFTTQSRELGRWPAI